MSFDFQSKRRIIFISMFFFYFLSKRYFFYWCFISAFVFSVFVFFNYYFWIIIFPEGPMFIDFVDNPCSRIYIPTNIYTFLFSIFIKIILITIPTKILATHKHWPPRKKMILQCSQIDFCQRCLKKLCKGLIIFLYDMYVKFWASGFGTFSFHT